MKRNQAEADPQQVHLALLSGLLSHIGMKDPKGGRDYQGARNARFQIFPGSALARRPPAWVMAAELVETSRLWGRDVARIEPEWVEPLAEHLLRRTYSEPRWDAKRGAGRRDRARDGLRPADRRRADRHVRADRPGALARAVHPPGARRGRVGGAPRLPRREPPPRRRGRGARGARAPARHPRGRRGALSTSSTSASRPTSSPARTSTAGGATSAAPRPTCSTYPREILVAPDAADALDPRARPTAWKQGDLVLALSYRFDPGAPNDGVTVHVPLTALGQLRPAASSGSCRPSGSSSSRR